MASKKEKQKAQEILEKLQEQYPGRIVNPLEILLLMASDPEKPWELRADAAKASLPFLMPKLSTVAITGKDDGPIQLQALTAIMMDPRLAEHAEALSLAIAGGRTAAPVEDASDDHGEPDTTGAGFDACIIKPPSDSI